jgi:hypothetical protein
MHWIGALQAAMPDLELVDRDLDLGGQRRAQLVGVDASGRLVLVLSIEGDDESTVLSALDGLAFARQNESALASHLRTTRLRPRRVPLVVLVAQSFSQKLLARLAGLDQEALRVLELRTVSSSRGEGSYLVAIHPAGGVPAPGKPFDARAFVASMPAQSRAVGELLMRRIARVDDELLATAGDGCSSWRLGQDLLCSVVIAGEALEGEVPERASRRIHSEADVESFVDEILARYVELLGEHEPEDAQGGAPALQPVAASAAMTAEELEAFRQPG